MHAREIPNDLEGHAASATFEDAKDTLVQDIASALNSISLEQREKIVLEQHGVSNEDIPDKATLDGYLDVLERELNNLKNSAKVNTEAFELALSQDPTFVEERDLRLRFLFTEEYDPVKAAGRMIRFFQLKRELFGDSKLTEKLTLKSLPPEDLRDLRKGFYQRLPRRDSAGRLVGITFPSQAEYRTPESLGRMLLTIAAGVEEWYDLKLVLVAYFLGPFKLFQRRGAFIYYAFRTQRDGIGRICAIHNCMNDKLFGIIRSMALSLYPEVDRAKNMVHCGTHMEVMYKLMTYGIPHHLIPVSESGNIKTKSHLENLRRREVLEQARRLGRKEVMILHPRNTDILLGKGKPLQCHVGNMSLLNFIDNSLSSYDNLNNTEKPEFSRRLVKEIKAQGGRFLSHESGVWTEVSDDVSREKIVLLFRNRRRLRPKNLNPESCENNCLKRKGVDSSSGPLHV